jgi:hypothetical protein
MLISSYCLKLEIVGYQWAPNGRAVRPQEVALLPSTITPLEYPPPAELSYVRVRNSDSLNPVKGFDTV